MSEKEFELYLSVLSRMLRMNPQQRESLSHELRDHLEVRFEELVRSGMARDDAIQQVLLEFGDATSLAGQFQELSRRRLRRVLLRSTAVVTAGVAALLIFGLNFLPTRPATQVVDVSSSAVADDPPAQSAAIVPLEASDEGDSPAVERIMAALSHPTLAEFVDTPLEDVCRHLAQVHSIHIRLDREHLEETGVPVDGPVNLNQSYVPPLTEQESAALQKAETEKQPLPDYGSRMLTLEQVLDLVCRSTGLDWTIHNEILLITTQEHARELRITRSYDISKLVADDISASALVNCIEEASGAYWQNVDGDGGTIAVVGQVLTVRHHWKAQRDVGRLLTALATRDSAPLNVSSRGMAQFTKALNSPAELAFVDTPLNDVARFIQDAHGIRVQVDTQTLEEAGIAVDEAVNIEVSGISLRSALKLTLEPKQLQAVLLDGVVTITTIERAQELMRTVLYDIREIDAVPGATEELQAALQSTTSGTWEVLEGEGGTALAPGGGRLLVRQTDQCHEDIARLLKVYRTRLGQPRAAGDGAPAVPAKMTTRYYHMAEETADDLLVNIPQLIAPETWNSPQNPDGQGTVRKVTQVRYVERKHPEPPKPAATPAPAPAKPADGTKTPKESPAPATSSLLAPECWQLCQFGGAGAGGPPVVPESGDYTTVRSAVLIIHQTAENHRLIDRLLSDLQLGVQGTAEGAGGFNGGGGGGFFSTGQ